MYSSSPLGLLQSGFFFGTWWQGLFYRLTRGTDVRTVENWVPCLCPSRLLPQSTTPWTAWCPRPSSASSWRPSAITLCSSRRTSGESVSSNGRPSASLWRPKASVGSSVSSWSLRCLQGSSRIESWGRHVLKVDWRFYECHLFLWISSFCLWAFPCMDIPPPPLEVYYSLCSIGYCANTGL